jgi:hypothetical protein
MTGKTSFTRIFDKLNDFETGIGLHSTFTKNQRFSLNSKRGMVEELE